MIGLMVPNTFATTDTVETVLTLTTTNSSYSTGDIIQVSGIATGDPNDDSVGVHVKSPIGNIVGIQLIPIDANGNYYGTFRTSTENNLIGDYGGSLFQLSGIYTIVAQYGPNVVSKSFNFTASPPTPIPDQSESMSSANQEPSTSLVPIQKSELEVDKLQQKFDEYWSCNILEPIHQDCLEYDEKHVIGISPTQIANYLVENDNTLTLNYEDPLYNGYFGDQVLHQELWEIYKKFTPNQILSQLTQFVIYTDDYEGDEVASVGPIPDYPLDISLSIDPADVIPSGTKLDKQFYVATLIHENGHILSLNSEQGNNDTNFDLGVKGKQIMLKKQSECAPNYYNDVAGCLYDDSYLNKFFQRFWAEIYPEHRWYWEFETYDEFLDATNSFYYKYEHHFISEYAGDNPDEDFAESFTAFVLKEKPSQSTDSIPEQKILFFYEYPELIEMRDFTRNGIATIEFCENDMVWKDGMCRQYVPPPQPQPSQDTSGGGCLIATAAFGSEMAPQVQFLRELRDNTVLQTQSGTTFMTGFNQFYYSFSPAVADLERENPMFKEAVKLTLTPLLTSLTLLNYVDIDTEQEMLGYGIGVILLNIGMYFIAPAVLIKRIVRIRI